MAASPHQLPAEVAAKYRCTIVPTRIELPWRRCTLDLRTLTLAQADELAADPKFTYLVPRRLRKKNAATSTTN